MTLPYDKNSGEMLTGLAAVLNSAGTLHSIKEPPRPDHFATEEQYEEAYLAWQLDVTTWKSSSKPTNESETSDA